VELEAQTPNELGTLVHRDAVPVQRVGISLRFGLVFPIDANFGAGSGLSVCPRCACVIT